MATSTVQALVDLGHRVDVLHDSYQVFGAGQFIWRLDGAGAVSAADGAEFEGYVAASLLT